MIERVVIIGSGNLAEALARAVVQSGLQLIQLFARNETRGRAVAALAGTEWTSEAEKLAQADIYLIAVSDRAVAELAAGLPIPAGAAVAHTAGSVALEALPARFTRRAVLYPLQTFTRGYEIDFRQVPLFLETDNEALRPELETFANCLSGSVYWADSAVRAKIHLAGVFACNFSNHMYALGERIMQDAGLDFDMLKPLISQTAIKALDARTPTSVQTGPAVRNDLPTQSRHEEMLREDPELKNMYSTISQSIWETSKKI